jgi:hypothetical protein
MYTVWAAGKPISIPLEELEDAKEFAFNSNMFAIVIDDTTQRNVWDVSQHEFSIYNKD